MQWAIELWILNGRTRVRSFVWITPFTKINASTKETLVCDYIFLSAVLIFFYASAKTSFWSLLIVTQIFCNTVNSLINYYLTFASQNIIFCCTWINDNNYINTSKTNNWHSSNRHVHLYLSTLHYFINNEHRKLVLKR